MGSLPQIATPWVVSLLLAACSGGGGGGAAVVPPSEDGTKPGGGRYVPDPHEGGQASRLHLAEVAWGRLVDVHDVDAVTGDVDPVPVFRDWVIHETVRSDEARYRLETHPITQATRLVILREDGAAAQGGDSFESLLLAASRNLPPVFPKHDDGTSVGPFSLVPRNACLVLRFDDLLDDSEASSLFGTVRLLAGTPPSTPFQGRVLFDANHGGIGPDGAFHSTRVLIDPTISEAELGRLDGSLELNSLGFPASLEGETDPNLSLRIPTRLDFGSGQFELLRNLSGGALESGANGPEDEDGVTRDVVRAFRSGRADDPNNGFLVDLDLPEVVGDWPLSVSAARPDPAGAPGRDFLVDLEFETPCAERPKRGDVVAVGRTFLEVVEPGTVPQSGRVPSVRMRLLAGPDETATNALLGAGRYLTTYDPAALVEPLCWFRLSPGAAVFPGVDVPPEVRVEVRFSEPMDPRSVRPFDTLQLIRGPVGVPPNARSTVVAEVLSASDSASFYCEPLLPLAHGGEGAAYHVQLAGGAGGVTDLAGNPLRSAPPFVELTVDRSAAPQVNAGIVLRFDAVDELDPERGAPDVRGQFLYDFDGGRLLPRPFSRRSVAADRTRPVPSVMIPFAPGVQTPLTPLGSRMQALYRYVDLGWVCDDETNFNVDVTGLSWSPVGGSIVADVFGRFEIALAHSARLPDEFLDPNLLPMYPSSGLRTAPSFFEDNVLPDPRDPGGSMRVVHARGEGYVVDPTSTTVSSTGTVLVPYPLNGGQGEEQTYTWRDTAISSRGGPGAVGIPMAVETGQPLFLDSRPSGSVAQAGQVPSFGLPLLMEFRCFPDEVGIGLNPLNVSIAVNNAPRPFFRTFSSGGIDTSGVRVRIDPDLALVPNGGFNPSMGGAPTPPADNVFYVGQLDLVTRISRVHTVFLDTLVDRPAFRALQLEPAPADQPARTALLVEARGAVGFDPGAGELPFDARRIDPYGDPRGVGDGQTEPPRLGVRYLADDPTWKPLEDVLAGALDGARFAQLRITFVNDLRGGATPTLSALALAVEEL